MSSRPAQDPPQGPKKPSTRWSAYGRGTWGPYFDVLFPPAMVTGWIDWKRSSTGVGIAKLRWAEREQLRRSYESVYGADPAGWPSQHPGVLLAADRRTAYPACLRCHYFQPAKAAVDALVAARRHETSGGHWPDEPVGADT